MSKPEKHIVPIPQEFIDFCEERGVLPVQVLMGIMGDLAGISSSEHSEFNSHGSDERRLAQAWFDRVMWGE